MRAWGPSSDKARKENTLRTLAFVVLRRGFQDHIATLEICLSTPNVDCGKQEQPDNVNEVPVPSCRFKADVTFRRKVTAL